MNIVPPDYIPLGTILSFLSDDRAEGMDDEPTFEACYGLRQLLAGSAFPAYLLSDFGELLSVPAEAWRGRYGEQALPYGTLTMLTEKGPVIGPIFIKREEFERWERHCEYSKFLRSQDFKALLESEDIKSFALDEENHPFLRSEEFWQFLAKKWDLQWPHDAATAQTKAQELLKSGAPGRPSSMHLVLIELRDRIESGRVLNSLAAESQHLADWLKVTHPNHPHAGHAAIRNGIRDEYNEYRKRLKL